MAFLPIVPCHAASSRLLERAIRRAGGRKALEKARLLSWEGDAVVHAGGRDVAIGVSSVVVPFHWARSTSWLAVDGPDRARTMVITPDAGWVERNGATERMPAPFVAHERAQFAIYGLMLLLPLRVPEADLRERAGSRDFRILEVEHPRAPATELWFERDGRLAEARNTIAPPEPGPPVRQRFLFSRETMPGPVRWPKRIVIEQEGRPYFELTLSRFSASAA